MRFEGKRIQEIKDDELLSVIGEREDLWLEFKQRGYRGRDDDGLEICKDIAALANASGGYILIGVGARRSKATGFHTVEKPASEVALIKSHSDKIAPRVHGLDGQTL